MRKRGFWRLVGFECRKAFLNPLMLVFIVVLLCFNGWKIHDSCEKATAEWEAYQQVYASFYELYQGNITPDKVSHLMAIYGPLEAKRNNRTLDERYSEDAYTYSEKMDEDFFRSLFVTEMKYDYLYQNQAYRISTNAQKLAQLYNSVDNRFEANKNLKISQLFHGRTIPEFSDTRGWEVLLKHDYSVMLVLLLTVFGLCGVFVTERETGMHMLLWTNRNGTSATVAAKLAASCLFVVTLCFLFFSQDFLVIFFSGGRNEGLSSPVYALRSLESTPLNITVGEYFLWAGGIKTFGVLVCGCLVLLLSSVCKHVLVCFLLSLGCITGFVLLQEFCHTCHLLRCLNPMELVICRGMITNTVFANVFSFPIRLDFLIIMGVLVVAALLCCGILFRNRGYHSRLGRRGRHVSV